MTTNTKHKPLDLAQFEGFTPGPWLYGGGYTRHVYGANSHAVCTLRAFSERFDLTAEMLKPDARLISAAPALLAECLRLRAVNAKLVEALRLVDQAEGGPWDGEEQARYTAKALANLRALLRELGEEA